MKKTQVLDENGLQLKVTNEQEAVPTAQPKAEQPAEPQEEAPKHHVIDDADDAFAAALGQGVEPTLTTYTLEITVSEDDMAKIIDFLQENDIEYSIR